MKYYKIDFKSIFAANFDPKTPKNIFKSSQITYFRGLRRNG